MNTIETLEKELDSTIGSVTRVNPSYSSIVDIARDIVTLNEALNIVRTREAQAKTIDAFRR